MTHPGRRTWSRSASYLVLAVVYAVAALARFLAAQALADSGILLAAFVADVVATVVVFLAALAFNNTSVYDPYWSVAPILLIAWWLAQDEMSGAGIVVLAVVAVWGLRLTANFLAGWTGLNHEDWRYTEYRRFGTAGYWAVSFGALQMMPTLIVFAGLLPVYAAVTGDGAFGALGVAGAAVALLAVWIESTADLQKRRFRAGGGSGTLTEGLWALVRHPNYLGEIGFWWGLALFGIAAGEAWTVVGAAAVTVLFVAVSIPLMDRRMEERRPGYRELTQGTPAVVPKLRSARRLVSRTTWRT